MTLTDTAEADTARTCSEHGIHRAADYVILDSEDGEIASRAFTRREADMERMPGDRVRFMPDPNPCGDTRNAVRFSLLNTRGELLPEFTLCAEHVRELHANFEHAALDERSAMPKDMRADATQNPPVWDMNPDGACAECGK